MPGVLQPPPPQWVYNLNAGTVCPVSLTNVGLMLIGDNDGFLTAIGSYAAPSGPASPASKGMSAGAKAGVALVVLAVVGVAGFFAYRKWGADLFRKKTLVSSYSSV